MIGGRFVEAKERQKIRVSLGFLTIAVVVAFVLGNRLSTLGDWFFAPYLNKGGTTLSQNLNFTATERVYDLLKSKFDGKMDMQALNDGLTKGLVDAAGDPYTTYMSAKEAEEFDSDLNGSFSGIGAELGKRNNTVVVIAPVSGSPAEQAGVRAGDIIAKVNDEDSTKWSVDQAVSKIRGEAGTQVKLTMIRESEIKPVEITITRAQISVPSVESEVLDGNIGYLKISRFGDDTAQLAQNAANDFKSKNVKGVIVDVRNNGGGLLDQAVKVAGLWLDNKVVVEEKEGGRTKRQERTGSTATLAGIPTKVLVNGGSASASEILAGALHDHGAAELIGEKTFGKGSVQELHDLDGGAKLKVTVARWFTPKGKNIDKEGIEPDTKVELTTEDFNANRDPQKDKAVESLR